MSILVFIMLRCLPVSATGDTALLNLYRQTVELLASDSMHGRACCSPDEKKCARYIAEEMTAFGAKVKYQEFSIHAKDSVHACTALNVYAFTNYHKDSTILIGAHYDHIGYGGKLSRSFTRGIHHGADDNASGVALLLGLMKNAAKWQDTNYNYVFIAYSAHEIGLYGSAAFAPLIEKMYGAVVLAINFDMVGRMDSDLKIIKIYGKETLGTDSAFFNTPPNGCTYHFGEVKTLTELDTRPFYDRHIPCLSFTTGVTDDYHKISDTADKIYHPGILLVQNLVEEFVGKGFHHTP